MGKAVNLPLDRLKLSNVVDCPLNLLSIQFDLLIFINNHQCTQLILLTSTKQINLHFYALFVDLEKSPQIIHKSVN